MTGRTTSILAVALLSTYAAASANAQVLIDDQGPWYFEQLYQTKMIEAWGKSTNSCDGAINGAYASLNRQLSVASAECEALGGVMTTRPFPNNIPSPDTCEWEDWFDTYNHFLQQEAYCPLKGHPNPWDVSVCVDPSQPKPGARVTAVVIQSSGPYVYYDAYCTDVIAGATLTHDAWVSRADQQCAAVDGTMVWETKYREAEGECYVDSSGDDAYNILSDGVCVCDIYLPKQNLSGKQPMGSGN